MTRPGKTPIVIVGAGGLARDVAWLIEEINQARPQWEVAGFTDLGARSGEKCGKYTILGDDGWLLKQSEIQHVAIAIGNPKARRAVYEKLKAAGGFVFPNLVHPAVTADWETVKLGEGNQVCSGAILTIDTQIGNNNILNHLVTVGHDVVIGDHCVINTATCLSGCVKIGDGCLLGAGSMILENKSIAAGTLVGIGSCVLQDIVEPGTYFGVPARKMAESRVAAVKS